MQRLEVSGAVRHIYASLGFKGLITHTTGMAHMKNAVRTLHVPYTLRGPRI